MSTAATSPLSLLTLNSPTSSKRAAAPPPPPKTALGPLISKSNDIQNPKISLHRILKIFKGFANHVSSLISNNPLLGERNSSVWSQAFCPPHAIAKELDKKGKAWDRHGLRPDLVVKLNKLSPNKRYKVSSIKFLNPRTRSVVNGAHECFGSLVHLKRGGVYTKQDLTEKLKSLSRTGLFQKIEFDAKTNRDGSVDINIPFEEKVYPSVTKFRCISVPSRPEPIEMDADMTEKEHDEYFKRYQGQIRKAIDSNKGCILPREVQEEIESMLLQQTCLSGSFLRRIDDMIEKWYRYNGYFGSDVVRSSIIKRNNFGREIICEVMEAEINKLEVKIQDKFGNINACEGNANVRFIKRSLAEDQVAVGKVFNRRTSKEALRNINPSRLFSKMKTILNGTSQALSFEIVWQQLPQMWSEVNLGWNIAPGRNHQPTLAWLQPDATISFGCRNIKGINRSFQGGINLGNLFDPQGINITGLSFEYKHLYLDGIDDPRNRTFHATYFSSRNHSPVFRGGISMDDTCIWVDRVGVKANITENYTRQSKFTYGLVIEDVKTRDHGGDIVDRGHRVSINGQRIADGPPTTLSGIGANRMAFFQANLTRDNTRLVNGAIVGDRDLFQVDQGFGLGAFFNRHKLTTTRFIPLKKVKEGRGKAPPPVLVLHGLYGGCVGDLPNHEAFTIGGPYSVKGYDMGEIGASRYKLEVVAEVRVPVKGAHVYAFVEHGNDLGSSMEVQGNPTKSYMRNGHGSSYGAGVQLGQLRVEYAVNNNTSKGAFFFQIGGRF